MTWVEANLGEICTLHYGKAARGYSEEAGSELPVQVFGTNGPIGWTREPLTSEPTIIVGRKGAYRGIHFSARPSWTIDTAYYTSILNGVDLKWLYYRLKLFDINSMNSGSAIPSTSREEFYALRIRLPDLSYQKNVADVLTAYDDLIANNQRRIELLDQSARHLFREWFVRLRYPGHEHDKVVEGVPEGWGRQRLRDLCLSVDYGYTASAEEEEVGPHFLRITDIVRSYIEWTSVPYCQVDEQKLGKFALAKGDLVVARTGATVGYAKRINKADPQAVFASYLVRLRPRSLSLGVLMGIFMQSDLYRQYVTANVGGAAQPNANAQVLSNAMILVPTDKLLESFRGVAEVIFEQVELLAAQIERLKTARDLLLPRLMDGRITV